MANHDRYGIGRTIFEREGVRAMPAITTTGIVLTITAISGAVTIIRGAIDGTRAVERAIGNIRDQRMQEVWKSNKNADSNVFSQRMRELEADINFMCGIIEEYNTLLQQVRDQAERTQQQTMSNATNLRSPRN